VPAGAKDRLIDPTQANSVSAFEGRDVVEWQAVS